MRVFLALVDKAEIARATEQLGKSIFLISYYEPRRFARLKVDLKGVLVHSFSKRPRAWYDRSFGFCELSTSAALADDFVSTACLIVHEGTHARFRAVRNNDPARRVRLERACLRQELTFLEKLLDGGVPKLDSHVSRVRDTMARVEAKDYTNAVVWADMIGEWKAATGAWLRR
jgi:hypothetical protein